MPLLLARCNSLLVQLSEFGKPPILDTLASSGPGKARLHLFVATACSMAQRFLSPAPFPEHEEEEAVASTGRGHLMPSECPFPPNGPPNSGLCFCTAWL